MTRTGEGASLDRAHHDTSGWSGRGEAARRERYNLPPSVPRKGLPPTSYVARNVRASGLFAGRGLRAPSASCNVRNWIGYHGCSMQALVYIEMNTAQDRRFRRLLCPRLRWRETLIFSRQTPPPPPNLTLFKTQPERYGKPEPLPSAKESPPA